MVDKPTPSAPPSVLNPIWHPNSDVTPPKKTVLTKPEIKSEISKNLLTELKNTANDTPRK